MYVLGACTDGLLPEKVQAAQTGCIPAFFSVFRVEISWHQAEGSVAWCLCLQALLKAKEQEPTVAAQMFIFISDIWLDSPQVMLSCTVSRSP